MCSLPRPQTLEPNPACVPRHNCAPSQTLRNPAPLSVAAPLYSPFPAVHPRGSIASAACSTVGPSDVVEEPKVEALPSHLG